MLIKCQTRLAHGTNGHSGRFSRSLIWLTKVEDGHCILHVEKCEGRGKVKHKFELKRNRVASVHMRRLSQGLLTIVLSSPLVEIFINGADKTQLESFVAILEAIRTGGNVKSTLVRAKEAKKPTQSDWTHEHILHIRQTKDYPVSRPFPPQLSVLHAEKIGLRQLDRRLPRLSCLSVLLLPYNRIADFDPDQAEMLSRLSLTRLDLADNLLRSWPSLNVSCRLHMTLRDLNLQGNPLVWLPGSVWRMEHLECLDLSKTKLKELPEGISSENGKLQELKLHGSEVGCLPSSAVNLRLKRLLPGEDETVDELKKIEGQTVISLQSWAMKAAMMSSRTRKKQQLLPWTVEEQLRLMNRCAHGLCPSPRSRFIAPDETHLVVKVTVDTCSTAGPMHSSGELVQSCGRSAKILQRWCIACAARKNL